MNKAYFFLLLFALGSCHHTADKLEPKVNYVVQDNYLRNLPSPFPPLTEEEKAEGWGKEYLIGIAFAHQLDLYQAITAFKRAEILAPATLTQRKLEINYEILLCYYLGKKYVDAALQFENSPLRAVDQNFPALHDLLIIMQDVYTQLSDKEKREQIESLIKHYYPEDADKLTLSQAFLHADMPKLDDYADRCPFVKDFLTTYESEKKSVTKAKTLNAVLPGAGYLYLGQKQTAATSFLLNGLFIAAAYVSFHNGNVAAGIIFTSFEAGWYFGGIHGAGEEAKFYNEQVYEKHATPMMNQKGLFPVFMLKYAF